MKIGYENSILQKIGIKRVCDGYYLRWWYNGWHYWFFLPGQMNMLTEGEKYRTIGTRSVAIGTGQINYDQCQAIRTLLNTREIYLLTFDGWRNIRIDPGSVITYKNQIGGYEIELIMTIGSREISSTSYSPVIPVPEVAPYYTPFDDPDYNPTAIVIVHENVIWGISITLEGNCAVTVYWGDGDDDVYNLVAGTPQVATHVYAGGPDEWVVTIINPECLTSIIAEGQMITQVLLPPNITNLEEIDFSGNDIEDFYIPPEATKLTTIDLSDNELDELHIPDTLVNLTDLDISDNNFTEEPVIPDTVPLETLDSTGNPLEICQVQVGTQVWMCKNYDSNYPGSLVYNLDEGNRALYGRLYHYSQVVSSGFVPPNYHVPTRAEWQELIDFCGGDAMAGGVLKAIGTTYFDAPNTDAVDTFGFGARGGGRYAVGETSGYFTELKERGLFWASDVGGHEMATAFSLSNTDAEAEFVFYPIFTYMSVRLLRNIAASLPQITDYDGNEYHFITIGTQQWLVENLKTTHYADGTAIPNLTLAADWLAEDGTAGHDGAFCYYDNDPLNIPDYGLLYNWYAVDNAHGLAIAGWRVPSDVDWDALSTFLGGAAIAGGKLKEIGLSHWAAPNTGATNEIGFTALPGGGRYDDGTYGFIYYYGRWWCSDESSLTNAWYRYMQNTLASLNRSNLDKQHGFSVRLMRDL